MPRALPYLLLLPATLFLCAFFLYPFALVLAESLTRDGGWSLANYQRMAGHWKFPAALRNTLVLTAVVVPVQLALALAMASIVSRLETGRGAILYVFAIPLGISDLAAGLIWLAIFEQSGFLNSRARPASARSSGRSSSSATRTPGSSSSPSRSPRSGGRPRS